MNKKFRKVFKQAMPLIVFIVFALIFYRFSIRVHKATDAQRYAILAKNIVEGKGYLLGGWLELLFPPGYPLLLVPFLSVGLSLDISVNLLLALTAGGYGLLSYLFISQGKNVYGFTILAVLLNGYFLLWGLWGQIEFVWLLVMLGIMYFKIENKSVIEGFLWSLAYLLKPETLAYLGLVLIYDLLIKKRKKGWLKAYLMPTLVVIGYSIFLYLNTDRVMFSGKSVGLVWDKWVESSVPREKYVYRLNQDGSVGIDVRNMRIEGIDWLSRLKINLYDLKNILFEVLLPFKWVVAALSFGFVTFKKLRKKMLMESFLFLPTLTILLFHVERRYLTVVMAVVFFWIVRFMTKGLASKSLLKKVAGGVFLVLLVFMIWFSRLPLLSEYPDLVRKKKHYIKKTKQLPSGINIIYARKPAYSFYREADYYPLPFIEKSEDMEKYVESLKNTNGVMVHDDWSKYTLPKTHEYLTKKSGQQGFGYVKLEN